jgi:hypothetical protein
MVLLQYPLQVEQVEQEQIEQLVVLLIILEELQLMELVVVEAVIIICHQVVIQLQERAEQELVLVAEHQEQEP